MGVGEIFLLFCVRVCSRVQEFTDSRIPVCECMISGIDGLTD